MERPVLSLIVLTATLVGCTEAPVEEPAAEGAASFCEPALARVDSFMATFAGLEPTGDRYGGTAVVGTVGELVVGMNGFAPVETGAAQHQMFVNLMTLIRYDENLEPAPYLARSWEVSEDFTELTFHLRDDVRWHDGQRTTAYDVEFTYLTASDPETGYPNASFFHYYLSGEKGVEVVDSFTVKFHLEPHADFMDPWRAVAIMPGHLLAGVPRSELARHPFGTTCPVGNGPFRFLSHTPGDRWVFEANPAFPEGLGGRPYLDRYVYRIIPEHSTLLAELLTGNVDLYVSLVPHHVERVVDDPDLDFISFPYRSVFFVTWNGRDPKLSDPRVRKALTLGANRRAILDGLRGGRGELINTGIPPTHWAFDSAVADSFPHDPGRARTLLAEAGWKDGDGDGIRESETGEPLRVEVIYNVNQERQEVLEIMQAQLREIGVDLQPRAMEVNALIQAITSPTRDFQGAMIAFETEFRMDERDLFHSEAEEGAYAFSGTRNPTLDHYLDTLQLIVDREEALPVWRAYQEAFIQEHPYTFLYSPDRLEGVNRRLRGIRMDVRGEWASIREWWIAPEDRKTP